MLRGRTLAASILSHPCSGCAAVLMIRPVEPSRPGSATCTDSEPDTRRRWSPRPVQSPPDKPPLGRPDHLDAIDDSLPVATAHEKASRAAATTHSRWCSIEPGWSTDSPGL